MSNGDDDYEENENYTQTQTTHLNNINAAKIN